MADTLIDFLPRLAAAASVLLMGGCGAGLLWRLNRVIRGREHALRARYAPGSADTRELLAVVLLAFASRLAIYAAAWGMHRLLGGGYGLIAAVKPLFMHWDTRHYVGIAEQGYTAVGDERLWLVFFPLYPWLMRLVSPLTGGDAFFAGIIISLACGSVSAGLLYELAHSVYGRRTARLAAAYFLLSPLSVFLCCAYTEALFICLTLAAVVLFRRGRPWLAAVFGMLSAFTRMPGVIVAGLFIIGAIDRFGRKALRAKDACCCAAQVLIVFCGLFAYWAVNWAVTGDPMMYLTYQKENWFQQPGSFWGTAENTAYYFLATVGDDDWLFTWGFQLLCMFYVFALLCFGQRKLPFDLAAYSFVYTAVVLAPTWLLSGPRYLYALVPLPLLQARMHKRPGMHVLALSLSGALLAVWIFGYAIAVEVL